MPTETGDVNGGGIRNSSKQNDQEEWTHATSAVDLTRIRPISVNSPTLLAQNDVYHSVNPVLQVVSGDDTNPVRRASLPDGKDPEASGNGPPPTNAAVPPPPDSDTGQDVRHAEAVRPMDLPDGAPVMTIPAPKPATF